MSAVLISGSGALRDLSEQTVATGLQALIDANIPNAETTHTGSSGRRMH